MHSPEEFTARLSALIGRPVRLRLNENSHSLLTVRRAPDGAALVNCHRMFLAAGDDVVAAVASFASKPGPEARRAIRLFIAAHAGQVATRPQREPGGTARGAIHDLDEIAGRLHREHFDGRLSFRIVWGRGATRRGRRRSWHITLGHWSATSRTIRIHPLLDSPDVPLYYVEFVVFHELAHAALPSSRDAAGRCRHHTPEFRALERRFPHYDWAIAWEKRHLPRLLRRTAPPTPARALELTLFTILFLLATTALRAMPTITVVPDGQPANPPATIHAIALKHQTGAAAVLFAPGEYRLGSIAIPAGSAWRSADASRRAVLTLGADGETSVSLVARGAFEATDLDFLAERDGLRALDIQGDFVGAGLHFSRFEEGVAAVGGKVLADDCRFFLVGRPVAVRRGAGASVVSGCEFIGGRRERELAIAYSGAGAVRVVRCRFLSMGNAVELALARGGGRSAIEECTFARPLFSAVRIRGAGELAILANSFTGAVRDVGIAIEGEGGPISSGSLMIARNAISDGATATPGSSYLLLCDANAFGTPMLVGNKFDGRSPVGCAVRIVATGDAEVRTAMDGIEVRNWGTALDVSGRVRIEIGGKMDMAIRDCAEGISLSGASLVSRGPSRVVVVDCDTGISVLEGGSLELAGAGIEGSQSAAIAFSGTTLDVRSCTLRRNQEGIVLSARGATPPRIEGNTFDLPSPLAFAIRNDSGVEVTAPRNRWLQDGLEYLAPGAIDDLVDDGDAGETPGLSRVLATRADAPTSGTLLVNKIEWDRTADRRTPGFGAGVFREESDAAALLAPGMTLGLGAGGYRLDGFARENLKVVGSGADSTAIVELDASPYAELLEISGATLRGTPGEAMVFALGPGAFTFAAGRIESAGASIVRSALEGKPLTLENVEIRSARAGSLEALLDIAERDVSMKSVRVETVGGPVIAWISSGAKHRFAARHLQIESGAGGPVVSLDGVSTLEDLTVTGGETALILSGPEVRMERATVANVTGTGIRLSGPGTFELSRLSIQGGKSRCTGLVAECEAGAATLSVRDLKVKNCESGARFAGWWGKIALDGARIELAPERNAALTEENGVEFALTGGSKGRDSRVLTSIQVSGYDAGFLMGARQTDSAQVVLGRYDNPGKTWLWQNENGIRLASPTGRLWIRENPGHNEIAENGSGILVEEGELRMENARLVGNQAGVLVKGGTVDLGGGRLGSTGHNVLWPQSGNFAVINESQFEVSARKNDWGEAAKRLGSEQDVINDAHDAAARGIVVWK